MGIEWSLKGFDAVVFVFNGHYISRELIFVSPFGYVQ